MQLGLPQITVQPGNQLLLKDITWQMFETILAELGENRSSRLSYSNGTLEILVPCMEHEVNKVLISDLVKILLEELDIEFLPLGLNHTKKCKNGSRSRTRRLFLHPKQSRSQRQKPHRLRNNLPPDLAIEIDLTSRTQFNNYEALGIPEWWRHNGRDLQIGVLQDGKYIQSDRSLPVPQLPHHRAHPPID